MGIAKLFRTAETATERFAEFVNRVVGHPVSFVLSTLQTIGWTVIVLTTHADPHGFWFLYLATAVSYVTQFTLTLVGLTAKREAQRAADESKRAADEMHELLQTISSGINEELRSSEFLEELGRNQADTLRAILMILDRIEENQDADPGN